VKTQCGFDRIEFSRFIHLTSLEARSTYRDSLGFSVDEDSYFLDVGAPNSFTDTMGMTDFVPEKDGFTTDLTLCHVSSPSSVFSNDYDNITVFRRDCKSLYLFSFIFIVNVEMDKIAGEEK